MIGPRSLPEGVGFNPRKGPLGALDSKVVRGCPDRAARGGGCFYPGTYFLWIKMHSEVFPEKSSLFAFFQTKYDPETPRWCVDGPRDCPGRGGLLPPEGSSWGPGV